jgi:hypothetical protein
MNEIKIIFPGIARVKKNSMTVSYIYKDKFGSLKIRMDSKGRFTPVTYYSKAYVEWAKKAIQSVIVFKSKQKLTFPLTDKYNLKCIFYTNENRVIDLSALYEGVQDVLTGRSGVLKDSVPGHLYQILEDDSVRFIGSHDGSRLLYLPAEPPRTEITITDFKY